MVRLIIWIIIVAAVARIVWRFVRAVLEGAGMLRDPNEQAATRLVRDPVCGMFVVPSRALTAQSGSTTAYFCSEKCRKAWRG